MQYRYPGTPRKRKGGNKVGILCLLGASGVLILSILIVLMVTAHRKVQDDRQAAEIEETKETEELSVHTPEEDPEYVPKDPLAEVVPVAISDMNLLAGAESYLQGSGKTLQYMTYDLTEETGEEQQVIVEDDHTETEERQRILFIGDSRTIDMFADSDDEMSGYDAGDDIVVFAKHGHGFDYMTKVIKNYGTDNFDVLVTWMGANDHGDFSKYAGYYDGILENGKRMIVCNVGPTDDAGLIANDHPDYENSRMIAYNTELVKWAEENDVKVIDLYEYINSTATVTIDPKDGIHYLPRPTVELWDHIVSELH